jgi:hypothetical protein
MSQATEAGLLGIYLNDHLATFTLAVDLARRAAGGRADTAAAATLRQVGEELEEDRIALRETMRALAVPARQYKVLLARAAERVGRLKPNGHLLGRSPLSDLVEAEGLLAAIEANLSCWQTLREVAEHDARLDVDRLRTLIDRAHRQQETVGDCRRRAAAEALLGTPHPATTAARTEPDATAGTDVEPPAHHELPLPDYDHLPTGSLTARIRALDAAGLEQLLAYERAHANRVQVVLILERRREELARGASPSSGDPTAIAPEVSAAPRG